MILAAGGGYYYYYSESLNSLNSYKGIATPGQSPAAQDETANDTSCPQFTSRFGISAQELVQFINNEPDAAIVMRGYRNVFGTVISLVPGNNLDFLVRYDSNAKIKSFECIESKITRDYSQDIDFTIPESDFAQIVRDRESLEAEQAAAYLQNVTTNPTKAKQIILEHIQKLQ